MRLFTNKIFADLIFLFRPKYVFRGKFEAHLIALQSGYIFMNSESKLIYTVFDPSEATYLIHLGDALDLMKVIKTKFEGDGHSSRNVHVEDWEVDIAVDRSCYFKNPVYWKRSVNRLNTLRNLMWDKETQNA